MKIAVVGGGSTYTPELVSGLSRDRERIGVRELVLQDIDPERREVVGGLAERMLRRQGYDGSLTVTDDLDRALDGADFVLIQIRVGGQEARLSDETVPLACGCIGQETTGAGGLGKALRTVPVVLEIAERTRRLAATQKEESTWQNHGRRPRSQRRLWNRSSRRCNRNSAVKSWKERRQRTSSIRPLPQAKPRIQHASRTQRPSHSPMYRRDTRTPTHP